jgi:hypothetical protein
MAMAMAATATASAGLAGRAPVPIRIPVKGRVYTVSNLRDLRCYAKINTASRDYELRTRGHCIRLVTWAIDTVDGIVFACNVDYEKYLARHHVDPDCICRLSDNERDFNEHHPGAGKPKSGKRRRGTDK